METWATFSIIDHRKPIYRQALALFDRIVVPVPPTPIDDQTVDELNQLEAEIAYLESENAAKRYEWSEQEYFKWRSPLIAEALRCGLNRDPFQDTRLLLAQNISATDVQAVPVYGGQEQ